MAKINKGEREKVVGQPFWIIVNWKRGAIWKRPFYSKVEALNEFNFQVSMLPIGHQHGWKIEARIPNEVYYKNLEEGKRAEMESMEGIAAGAVPDELDSFVEQAGQPFKS